MSENSKSVVHLKPIFFSFLLQLFQWYHLPLENNDLHLSPSKHAFGASSPLCHTGMLIWSHDK